MAMTDADSSYNSWGRGEQVLLVSSQSSILSAFTWKLIQACLLGTSPVQKCGVRGQKRPLGEHKPRGKAGRLMVILEHLGQLGSSPNSMSV